MPSYATPQDGRRPLIPDGRMPARTPGDNQVSGFDPYYDRYTPPAAPSYQTGSGGRRIVNWLPDPVWGFEGTDGIPVYEDSGPDWSLAKADPGAGKAMVIPNPSGGGYINAQTGAPIQGAVSGGYATSPQPAYVPPYQPPAAAPAHPATPSGPVLPTANSSIHDSWVSMLRALYGGLGVTNRWLPPEGT
jgi:hypothetical protein